MQTLFHNMLAYQCMALSWQAPAASQRGTHNPTAAARGVLFGAQQRAALGWPTRKLRNSHLLAVGTFGSLPSTRRPSAASTPEAATASSSNGTSGRRSPSQELPAPDPAIASAYLKLQNGSDIRGVAIEGVPDEPVTMTPTVAFYVGLGFADWLEQNSGTPASELRVSIGEDPRMSGAVMSASLAAGLAARGVTVGRLGLCTTPAMFMSCVLPGWSYDGAIMVTASHLPFNRNGLKFCTPDGGLEKANITAILQAAAAHATADGAKPGATHLADVARVMRACLAVEASHVEDFDFLPTYAGYIKKVIREGVAHPTSPDRPLEGWKIIVNAGNGAGGFFATQVLEPLGADISGSINLVPDGTFPNHMPNPEDRRAMAATVEAVLRSGSDLGIVFDTDVDRSGVVDAQGTVINKNRYIALMSAITLRDHPGSTIVTCSTTSNGLSRFVEARGGKHFRYRKGYRNVIGKGIELNKQGVDCELMMETSGHGAMRENYFLDDGAYAAVKIVIEAVKRRLEGEAGLKELLAELKEPVEANEFRLRITDPEGAAAGKKIVEAFGEWVTAGGAGDGWAVEEPNYEGVRVRVPEGEGKAGWLLLRSSLHDPQLVLNAETEEVGGVSRMLCRLGRFFDTREGGDGVDTEPIFAAIASFSCDFP